MTAFVSQLVAAAYNRSAANDPGKLSGDAELVAHLDRCYQRAWALVAKARPDEFASVTTLTMAGSPPQATLPADVIAILRIQTAAGVPVQLIPLADRSRAWHLPPCVYRQGRTLVSRASGTVDPLVSDVLTVTLLDAPAPLTAVTSALDPRWPARHLQLLVDLLAVYLSTKDAARPASEHAKLAGELQQSALAFAAEYGLAPDAVEWLHAPAARAAKDGA